MSGTWGAGPRRRRAGRGEDLGEREKRRLLQLGVCLILFLTVFFTKGIDRLGQARAEFAGALGADGDFQSVLAVLRGDVSPQRGTLHRLWEGLFLPKEKPAVKVEATGARLTSLIPLAAPVGSGEESREDPMEHSAAIPEPEVVPVAYTGPALPENASMDKYALHLEKTVTPVLSHVTSPFGWREDPVEAYEEKFHYGLDISAAEGTPVLAFAAGKVEYIGESQSYGLYLQLDHGGGVKSFYAHCSKLLAREGEQVAAGEEIARTGATGRVTGPHLHFELKKDELRLNPAYYIQVTA